MGDIKKRLAILGSTGSIGRQTLQVVRNLSSRFRVVALTAGQNTDLLAGQIDEFRPDFVHYQSKQPPDCSHADYEYLAPEEIARHTAVDTVVVATSGKAGLMATLSAARAGKDIALSNKESLVMAGSIIMREARENGARILPVDSEHSAIWQCLRGEEQSVSRLILTASGGPFRSFSAGELEQVTAEQALKHPSWKMGKKVTIDSATLMNKGLEIIEAHWLFDMPYEKIQVVVHPQSIIHSMVEFEDGSIKAQMSPPDMRLPIQYALTYPERICNTEIPRLDWSAARELTLEKPDFDRFPCLEIAIEAGTAGGTSPAVLCAADEVAVELFLAGSIGFSDIARLVRQVLGE
ncbi:MAG TPA: 1-deoxy-D-xylulose-5-phosphate reductoisomerase, partial [Dehalococcoidia bacterium]|nr:1-deoxy-D-xylulose-5-phosphate reductoisomerase [Dehalococcoidia bacterium]